MKKVNWKGNLIALGCILAVVGLYFLAHPIQSHQMSAAEKAIHDRTEQDLSYIEAKESDITDEDDDNSNDDSGFADTSYMEDKPEIKVGMFYQEVLEAIGEPDDKVTSKDKYGTSELWSYGNKTLFFESGVLENITEVK